MTANLHDTEPPRSVPPPLPESASHLQSARVVEDDALADTMLERLAAADYEGAIMAAEALLEYRPRDRDALDAAQIAKTELRKVYVARLGSLDRVPHIVMGPDAIFALKSLDFRAGFLLSRVDGLASIYEIVEGASIPSLEALGILSELYLRRVIAFE
jgi:hypothetical protein